MPTAIRQSVGSGGVSDWDMCHNNGIILPGINGSNTIIVNRLSHGPEVEYHSMDLGNCCNIGYPSEISYNHNLVVKSLGILHMPSPKLEEKKWGNVNSWYKWKWYSKNLSWIWLGSVYYIATVHQPGFSERSSKLQYDRIRDIDSLVNAL